ncbi:MAG: NADH-quinone oxidoreductase subunit N [Bacteriovoracaceae bacterium]
MEHMSFLPTILVFVGLLSLSTLSLIIPKKGRIISYFLTIMNYCIFLYAINSQMDLGLTNLFQLNSLGAKILSISTIFAIIMTLINGYSEFKDVRNSLITSFIFLGAIFLVGSTEFITFYVSLELMSLMGYSLVRLSGLEFSKEAAVKYFIQGSINSTIFLLAIAFFYGATGGFEFKGFTILNHQLYAFSIGLLLIVAFFKLGAFPFHSWVPDVYSNVHKGVLASNFLITKFVTGFILITLVQNLISDCEPHIQQMMVSIIIVVSIISAFYGNIMGLAQNQFKRMIAYSSVAHSGYMLMTIGLNIDQGYEKQLIFYLMFYSISATAVILLINFFLDIDGNKDTYEGLKGGFYKNHLMGTLLCICVLSLAGIPLTSGFASKYLLFTNYFKEGLIGPALALLISSIIGIGYYIKVVISLFMEEKPEHYTPLHGGVISLENKFLLTAMAIVVILGGVLPSIFINF